MKYLALVSLLVAVAADDRIHFADEDEKRNTPPQLTSEPIEKSNGDTEISPRFLPFSASFSLNAGASNAHSLSVGAGKGGISLSQSASQSLGNSGPGFSASQSSSFSAGLSGISAADSNAFNSRDPLFGETSRANGNSFSLGQASASSHGQAHKGQASSAAQSSVGNVQSSAHSGASANGNQASSTAGASSSAINRQGRPHWNNIRPNIGFGGRRPSLSVSQSPNVWASDRPRRPIRLDIDSDDRWQSRQPEVTVNRGWYLRPSRDSYNWNGPQNDWNGSEAQPGISWSQFGQQRPQGVDISAASASSSATSGPNGFSFGQSSSKSQSGLNPSSSTINRVETSGDGRAQAQGVSAAVGSGHRTDASFSSAAISGMSGGNGHSAGSAISSNRGSDSQGNVALHSNGGGSVTGNANSGAVSFPGDINSSNISRDFARSGARRNEKKNPIDIVFDEITDTVSDLFNV